MTDGVHRKWMKYVKELGSSLLSQLFAVWRTPPLQSPQTTRERLDLVLRCSFQSITLTRNQNWQKLFVNFTNFLMTRRYVSWNKLHSSAVPGGYCKSLPFIDRQNGKAGGRIPSLLQPRAMSLVEIPTYGDMHDGLLERNLFPAHPVSQHM